MEEIMTASPDSFISPEEEIEEMIGKAAAKATLMAAIPVPLVDLAVVTWIQIHLIHEIAEKLGIAVTSKSKLFISTVLTTITGKMLSEGIIKVSEKIGFVNVIGEYMVRGTIAGFITTISGEVYANHFKVGGNIENFTLINYLDYLLLQIEEDRLNFSNLLSNIFQQINKYR